MLRAAERCEFCRAGGMVLDWHHIVSGGARRFMERSDTTCAICRDCHRGWERNSVSVLRAAKEWAIGTVGTPWHREAAQPRRSP
jgi:hypothetical protein